MSDLRDHFTDLLRLLGEPNVTRKATTIGLQLGGPERLAAIADPAELLGVRDVGPLALAAWAAVLERMELPPAWWAGMHYWHRDATRDLFFKHLGKYRAVLAAEQTEETP